MKSQMVVFFRLHSVGDHEFDRFLVQTVRKQCEVVKNVAALCLGPKQLFLRICCR